MTRFMTACATVCLTLAGAAALADGDYMTPVQNALTKEECSACHMAYPAGFLPAASWQKIMATLDNHFGEDASLPEGAAAEIRDYLVAGAATRLRGVDPQNPPMRITELDWFTSEHGARTRAKAESRPEIGSLSNCVACHKGAERGYFED